MDSSRNVCHVNDEDSQEKIQENKQLSRDPGQNEEIDENGPKSLIMEIYPWITQFKKMCRNSIAQTRMSSLKTLMTFYARNVRSSVNECRTKPLRAEKLKDSIGETLLFFLYYYRDIVDCKDRDYYLFVMSDLVAMYIDMELKASKKGKEHCSKISARLSSCLHVYLEHSAEHLLDTLLKVHFMTHNYHEILDPVITKIFKIIDVHPCSSLMYVRYLLAYRLWKKLNKDMAVRNQINMIAITSLGTAPNDFPTFIIENVLPQVPKNQKLSTKLLMFEKLDIEKSREEFLNFCNNARGLDSAENEDESCKTSTIASLPEENKDCRELLNNNNNNNLSIFTKHVTSSMTNTSSLTNEKNNLSPSSTKRPSVLKQKISFDSSLSRRTKKTNEIVIIDLTSDVIKEKIIRNKKTRRKLYWLEEAKKRISSKNTMKKDSPNEDKATLEDCPNLQSLHISEKTSITTTPTTASKMEILVDKVSDKINEEIVEEETASTEDTSRVLSIETTCETLCTVTNSLVNESFGNMECSQLETQNNEMNRLENVDIEENEKIDVSTSHVEVSSIQVETLPMNTLEENTRNLNIDETRELPVGDVAYVMETLEKLPETEMEAKDKEKFIENVPIQLSIKNEKINVQSNEITNEVTLTNELQLQVTEYTSEVSLTSEEREETVKIPEVEFQENIDGLSLLASVSQRISHLTTASPTLNPVELIKVKNYASLADPNVVQLPDTSSEQQIFSNDSDERLIERHIDIYPEAVMDKVAYQVEVTSTNDTDIFENCDQSNGHVTSLSNSDEIRCNTQLTSTIVDAANHVEKDDTNVILNGETVVLYQKSPNSNLYIINKAVENRDHANDDGANVATTHREMTDHVNDSAGFTYEIYDTIYRNQASNYDITQYNRDLSNQEIRRGKILKSDQSVETSKMCVSDSLELTKTVNNHDLISDKTRIKRKTTTSGISRRRRIKQEYNGCSMKISNHIDSNYDITDCPQEHTEASHSIHIPVAHTASMSSIYTKYPSTTELYLPCNKNCNSITCGLTVPSAKNLHSHSGNATTVNTRCNCLNCTYDIMTHCSECIIQPNVETRGSSIDPNSYYMPMINGQNSNVQDCKRTQIIDDKLANIYDDQLVLNFGEKTLDDKPLESVKLEAKEIYRAELDNKLPLKKRFKAIMSMSYVDDVPIKFEKIQSYPSTPMLSIAALESAKNNDNSEKTDITSCLNDDSANLGSKLVTSRGETTEATSGKTREMIRRDYRKDTLMSPPLTPAAPIVSVTSQNGTQVNGMKRKRGKSQNSMETKEYEMNYERIGNTINYDKQREHIVKTKNCSPTKTQTRPSEKVKLMENLPTKIATRKTRSSKRNVPKVNYIYTDGDSDWNPSVNVGGNSVTKRKRKKTNR